MRTRVLVLGCSSILAVSTICSSAAADSAQDDAREVLMRPGVGLMFGPHFFSDESEPPLLSPREFAGGGALLSLDFPLAPQFLVGPAVTATASSPLVLLGAGIQFGLRFPLTDGSPLSFRPRTMLAYSRVSVDVEGDREAAHGFLLDGRLGVDYRWHDAWSTSLQLGMILGLTDPKIAERRCAQRPDCMPADTGLEMISGASLSVGTNFWF